MRELPIDEILPEAEAALRIGGSLVVEAPPGAGKTTRVPIRLLDAGLAGDRDIWVLEPRRLAARLAAERVAAERGERVGETVGYQVRFDIVVGPATRVRYVTEAILTRTLVADRTVGAIGVVVLDEFHERRLDGDLALALLRELQRSTRPDLKIVVMSATLDASPVADFLDAPTVRSEGRAFDVDVDFAPRFDDRPLEERVAAAIRELVEGGLDGDVLVFLPGAAEIRRCRESCRALADRHGLLLETLHGDLSADEQDRAIRPSERRKIILSTNVAESSVTIEGVVAVVDSGLARVASHSAWSGLPTLRVERISRASAVQRAGRAGRLRPGRCVRLYTAQDWNARPEHDTPEIRRVDLADAALALHAAGVRDLSKFPWFEAPDARAVDAAERLLEQLGAIEASGGLTDIGRRMSKIPLHPRLSRILVETIAPGLGREGCLVAALASERSIVERRVPDGRGELGMRRGRTAATHGPSDLLDLTDRFAEAEAAQFVPDRLRAMGLDAGAVRAVDRARRQLEGVLGLRTDTRSRRVSDDATERHLLHAILSGFPDRVARRLGGESKLALAGGGSAELARESVVRTSELLVAVEAEERRDAGRRGETLVRVASAIEPEWLIDLFPDAIRETSELEWNARDERVEAVERMTYGAIVLDERRTDRPSGSQVAMRLAREVAAAGVDAFVERAWLDRFLGRVDVVRGAFPEEVVPAVEEDDATRGLGALCDGRRSFAEIRAAVRAGELEAALRRGLGGRVSTLLDAAAPDTITVGRRRMRIGYERGKPPWVASRLQDFFGMRDGPRIGRGRVALVLHLLAPNNRPVQVTSDLAGFWVRHYPQLRRELGRRYPRHSWPEEPAAPL